jgi:hypothetical protein
LLLARIVSASQKDWKAASWALEKLFPAEFRADIELEPNKVPRLTILYDTGGKKLEELLDFPIHPSMKQTEVGREQQARALGETEKAPISDAPPPKVVPKAFTGRIRPE